MGSAASLIKAHEEETNGRAAPLRTAPLYIAGTGPSPDGAGWIRSGCDSIRLYAKEQDLVELISIPDTDRPESLGYCRVWMRELGRSSQFMNDPTLGTMLHLK